VLRQLVDELGMRSTFVSRIDRDARRVEVLAAHNVEGGCNIPRGGVLPLGDSS
jgi:hypothetical protein